MVKSYVRAILLRLQQAAQAHEAKLAQERCAGHVLLGRGSTVDYRKVNSTKASSLRIGESTMFAGACIFERSGAIVEVGSRTYFNGNISCAARITIGDDVLISSGGGIFDHDSHALDFAQRQNDVIDYIAGRKDWSHVAVSSVTIERRAWIGFGVIILKGVTIGEGAVVGAGSVVTKSIPAYTLAAGNPARVIRFIKRAHMRVVGLEGRPTK